MTPDQLLAVYSKSEGVVPFLSFRCLLMPIKQPLRKLLEHTIGSFTHRNRFGNYHFTGRDCHGKSAELRENLWRNSSWFFIVDKIDRLAGGGTILPHPGRSTGTGLLARSLPVFSTT